MKFYFTFGQRHRHVWPKFSHTDENGESIFAALIFDKDCVALIEAESYGAARERAWKLFDNQWCMQHDNLIDARLQYYPRGVIEVPSSWEATL